MKEFSVFPNTAVRGSESGANLVACALFSALLGISSFLYTNGGAKSRERFNLNRISTAYRLIFTQQQFTSEFLDNKRSLSHKFPFNFRVTFSLVNNKISAREENAADGKSAFEFKR